MESFFDMGISQVTGNHGIQETKIYRTTDGNRVIVTHTFNTILFLVALLASKMDWTETAVVHPQLSHHGKCGSRCVKSDISHKTQ